MLERYHIDLQNPHFKKTEERMDKWLKEYTTLIPDDVIINSYCRTFPASVKSKVSVQFNGVYMLCPHHFLPVDMTVEVEYIPSDKILGLSKFKRVAQAVAKFPRTQEEYTDKIFDLYKSCLQPRYLKVTVKGKHYCVLMRGVRGNSDMTTVREYEG